jgi:exodeoxyribonuclease VII large subunit
MSDRIWTVSGLIREVNSLLEQGFSGIRVEGEVTNLSRSARGHVYFSLKDDSASLDAVMWASRVGRLKFEVEDGLAMVAAGSLTIYPQRGRFQMVVDSLEPQGLGALQLAFEQLKKRLSAEGLFDEERKRPMPDVPSRVGIVTSLSGAALHDMLRVLSRHPNLEVVVAPAAVQGEGAAAEIAGALGRLSASGLVDVIIVGRGGGSLEDLWSFNEEVVARAIVASEVPVISGVGHEVDFTISDFVADVRATTPTQAAELVVARLEHQERRLDTAAASLLRQLEQSRVLARARLDRLAGSSGLARVPHRVRLLRSRLDRAQRLRQVFAGIRDRALYRLDRASGVLRRLPTRVAAGGHRRVVDSRRQQLGQLVGARLQRMRDAVSGHQRALNHLSPKKVLDRGYSITTLEGEARPLTDPGRARPGQALLTTLSGGELRSVVAGRGGTTKRPRQDIATDQISLFEEGPEESRVNGDRGSAGRGGSSSE